MGENLAVSAKFDSAIPCATCPFGRGGDSLRHMRPDRLIDIANADSFTCHKTTTQTGDGSERECAGFMIHKVANGGSTQMMRIAARIGLMPEEIWDSIHEQADAGESVVCELEELIELHDSGEPG